MDYGQLVVELVGDYSKLKASLAEAKQQALKDAADLERIYKLSPSLDTTELKRSIETLGLESGRSLAKNLQQGLNSQKISLANVSIDAKSLRKVGVEVGAGLAEGIRQSNSQARKAAGDMAGLVIDESKRRLKIKSPSGVFKEIGENIVQGLASGLATGSTLAVGSLINGVIDTAKSAVDKAFDFTGDSINKYANQKAVTAQLSIQLGDPKAAQDSLKFVREESDRLGFSLENSQKQFASLISNAKGSKLSLAELKEVYTSFNTLGRVNQLSNDDLKGVFTGLEQSFSKGKLQAEELRGQIAERLPGALALVSKALGVTQAQLDKLLSSGQLKPDQVWLLFAREVQKEYGGKLTDSLNNSTVGFTKLSNTIYELQASLGQAIEPAVISGLTFITDVVKQLGEAGLFSDLNLGAQQFSEYLKQNPQIAAETADIISNSLKSALNYVVTLSGDLLKYLKENPNAIAEAATAIGDFGQGIGQAVGFAKDLLGVFLKIGETIDNFYDKLSGIFGDGAQQEKIKNFLRFGPASLIPGIVNGDASTTSGGLVGGILSAATGGLSSVSQEPSNGGLIGGILAGIQGQASSTSRAVSEGIQLLTNPNKPHHRNGRAYSAGNDGQTYRGGMLVKDVVLAGGTKAPVPAPVGGIVKLRKDDPNGYGNYADIVNAQGQLLARLAHFSKFADGLKSGQVVTPGQILGNQGHTGRGTGTHLHVELPRELWADYVQSLKTGNYSRLPSANQSGGIAGIVTGTTSILNQRQQPQTSTVISAGSSSSSSSGRRVINGNNEAVFEQQGLPRQLVDYVKGIEDFKAKAYPDFGQYSVGFGTKAKSSSETLTVEQANVRLASELKSAVAEVRSLVRVPINQNQLSALASFQYNTGGLKGSTLLQKLNAGDTQGAAAEFGRWNKATENGRKVELPGLTRRRAEERAIFLGEGTNVSTSGITPETPTSTGQQPANIAAILAQQEEQARVNRRNAIRQTQDLSRSASKIALDAYYGSELNPNPDAKNTRAAAEKLRLLDEQKLTLQRQREDAQSRITINQNKVSSGSLTEDELKDTELALNLDKKLIRDLDNSLKSLTETRAKTSAEYQKFNERDRKSRLQQSDLRLDQQGNEILEKKLAGLKELQNINPYAKELQAIPKLERELALRQEDAKLRQSLQDLDNAYSKHEIDSGEYSVRLDNLEKLNAQEVRNIDIKYKSAQATERQRTNALELSKVLQELGDISEDLRLKSQLREFGIGTGDRYEMDRDSALVDNQAKGLQEVSQLNERARLENFTPEQLSGERIRQAIRDNQRRSLINAQYDRQVTDRDYNSGSKVSESLQNLLSSQADQRQGLGLDAKQLQKQAAFLGQGLDFSQQIRDLQRLKDSGDITADAFSVIRENLEALNQVKLQTINNEFNDFTGVIRGVQSDTQSVFKDFLLGTESIGSSISKIFQSILNNLADMASKMLSDQLFGSIFGAIGGGGSGSGILSSSSFAGDANGFLSGVFADGGMVPNFAGGGFVGSVADAMQRERSQTGRQPHLIVASAGERVLTPEEAQRWNRIQGQNRLQNYADGGMVGSTPMFTGSSSLGGDNINVNVPVNVAGGSTGDMNIPLFAKIIEGKIQQSIKDERRPGGSLSRGQLYDR